ncbi:hypothetical protein GTQ40_08315 [Flavobacteriaceae bacterium R38]|nr:hypothetical protein [Flavobacteriaceae bacterium R38]
MKKKKVKSNNDKLLIGLIAGAVLGFLIYYSLNVFADFSKTIFIVFVAIAILIAIILLVFTWFRGAIIRKFFGKDIEFSTVINDTQETLNLISEKAAEQLPIEEDQKQKLIEFAPKIINYLLWSNFRNWGLRIFTSFVLGLGGIVTTILFLNQNKLFEIQNKRIDQQTHLAEASRRSSQIFIMGEVLGQLNQELILNRSDTLSNTLVGRIISLSRAMKPYRYLNNDSLISKPLSPERGQFLISLVESKIDSSFFTKRIIRFCDFQYSDLNNANLSEADLWNINLQYSDLRLTNFWKADLTHAYLMNADLRKASLREARLINANFANSDLTGANLSDADLYQSDFTNVLSLDSVEVDRTDWLIYIRDSLQLKGSHKLFNDYRVDSVPYNPDADFKKIILVKKNRRE